MSELFDCSLDYLLRDSPEAYGKNKTDSAMEFPVKRLWERKSGKSVWNMPLWHIGRNARGFFAVGLNARGVIAIGLKARGIVSLGFLSAGLLSFGMLSLGLLSLGMLALGFLSAGCFSIGIFAAGAISFGIISRRRLIPESRRNIGTGQRRHKGTAGCQCSGNSVMVDENSCNFPALKETG